MFSDSACTSEGQCGTLWIVATPLGNPGDLCERARQVLEAVDFVLAEDTRRSGLLFAECGVKAGGFVSFHEHNEEEQLPVIIAQLEEGRNIALVSDAGFPTLSDPGFRLIRALRKKGLKVSVVPGPSAILTALAGSGIAPQPFAFLGFIPRKDGDRARLFAQYAEVGCTLVFFERKDRLAITLETAYSQLGPREVCIAREMTKTHEEFIFGRLGAWGSEPDLPEGGQPAQPEAGGGPFPPENLLGEITVVIGPAEKVQPTAESQVLALAAWFMADQPGLKPKELARQTALAVQGWTARSVYRLLRQHEGSAYAERKDD